MYKYQAQIKINKVWIKTIIYADNPLHAKLIAQYQYGISNVLFTPIKVGSKMKVYEISSAVKKPLTPDQGKN
jgi:hypothetical protein